MGRRPPGTGNGFNGMGREIKGREREKKEEVKEVGKEEREKRQGAILTLLFPL